jgi:dTDP-L-rhamnose 4-epimerase
MPSALLTGGAGFIGCALARRLLGAGWDVAVLDNLHPQVHAGFGRPADLPADALFLTGDVTSEDTWRTVTKLVQPDTVVHLAAETGTGQSLAEASRHGMVNVVGTTRMLDALYRTAPPAHIVLPSSRAVYGEGQWEDGAGEVFAPDARRHDDLVAGIWDPRSPSGRSAVPLPSRADRTPPRPSNVYAATKLAQEHVINAWAAATGTAVSVLRLQNVYGPGQSLTNSYTGVVALFARLAAAGRPIEVYEDGVIVRDFVFIDDVADALAAAVARPPSGSRTVDVGSGAPTTIAEAAALLARLAGAPDPVVTGKFRDGDVRAASCDIARTRDDIGYAPAWGLERGLGTLLEWVREQGS